MVEAARKYNKICQAGTQCRSMSGTVDAVDYVRSGKIGEVKLARGLCYKNRDFDRAAAASTRFRQAWTTISGPGLRHFAAYAQRTSLRLALAMALWRRRFVQPGHP